MDDLLRIAIRTARWCHECGRKDLNDDELSYGHDCES